MSKLSPDDRAWTDLSEAFRRDGLPKILRSAAFVSYPAGVDDLDVKQAMELGAAMLLDKPLLLLVPPGRTLGARLRRAADLVLDDFDIKDPASQNRLTDAILTLTEKTPEDDR